MARFFIHRPIFAWVIALLIMLVGVIALKKLPVSQYPQVAPPQIAFNVTYPGASAQVVEDTVIKLIEQEMNGIENLLYMEASSELGAGTLTLTFEPGTNIDISSVEAQNRYKRVESRVPEDVRRLGVPVTKPQRNYLMFVAIHSKDGKRNAIDLGSFAADSPLPLHSIISGAPAKLSNRSRNWSGSTAPPTVWRPPATDRWETSTMPLSPTSDRCSLIRWRWPRIHFCQATTGPPTKSTLPFGRTTIWSDSSSISCISRGSLP